MGRIQLTFHEKVTKFTPDIKYSKIP